LASLHPLRQPELINWWPLAPGWWALIVLTFLLLGALALFFYRRYRANLYRRQALSRQAQLHADWLTNRDGHRYLSDTNALLKSVALRVFPRQQVASCHGEQWVGFLNTSMPTRTDGPQFQDSFATAAYRQDLSSLDCEEVQASAMIWIRQHKVAK